MGGLIVAMLAFVGSHELLSHPLRRPLVDRIGERGFLGLYSIIALVTFIWVVAAYRDAPATLLWTAPRWAWDIGSVVMLVASVLFVGSLIAPNPALPTVGHKVADDPTPRGVMRITRHPMMWSFALWAVVHALLSGMLAMMVLAAGIGFLALFGAAMQERKKAALLGPAWAAWAARTSFVPFARGFAWPGWLALIGGVAAFAGMTWAHAKLFDAPVVGVWSYL